MQGIAIMQQQSARADDDRAIMAHDEDGKKDGESMPAGALHPQSTRHAPIQSSGFITQGAMAAERHIFWCIGVEACNQKGNML